MRPLIVCVIGTRPEAIKLAPVVRALRSHMPCVQAEVVLTGQHKEMLQPVLDAFELQPDRELSLPDGLPLELACAAIMQSTANLFTQIAPSFVMVQGDTTSALAAALTAFYMGIPLAHVEAGLRTGDLTNPFPEEGNRILIDHMANVCFAPTMKNRASLLSEGISDKKIIVTGNTGIDALFALSSLSNDVSTLRLQRIAGALFTLSTNDAKLVLITLHRRESFGPIAEGIFRNIGQIARGHGDWHFVFPVHPNPKIRIPALAILSGLPNVFLVEPVPYPQFVQLMTKSSAILTDFGGIQEEAPSLGKPVFVLRDKTERQEALAAGAIRLVGTDGSKLASLLADVLNGPQHQVRSDDTTNPFGDGRASERIVRWLQDFFNDKSNV